LLTLSRQKRRDEADHPAYALDDNRAQIVDVPVSI
jgi:hypothetical protein